MDESERRDEFYRGVNAALEWGRIRLDEEHTEDTWTVERIRSLILSSHNPDVYHSALLLRMCGGKAPLPVAPPKAYSYPWYDLIDLGGADLFDGEVDVEVDNGEVWIAQYRWKIVAVFPDGSYRLEWDEHNPLFTLTPKELELPSVNGDLKMKGWRLERIT
jgi:hypothetical protein